MGRTIKLANDTYLVNDLYSTTEKKVGTWIDGKPLYRKVIQFDLSNETLDNSYYSVYTGLNTSNIIRKIDCYSQSGYNLCWFGRTQIDMYFNYYGSPSQSFSFKKNSSQNDLKTKWYLIIEYTKNTY